MKIEAGRLDTIDSERLVRFEERPNIREAIEKLQTIRPEVVFDVFFAEHTIYDQGLTPKIETCDLFIPESGGWEPHSLQIYNDVSQGKNFPYDCGPFKQGLLRALKGTNKPVRLIDLPADHPDAAILKNLYHGDPDMTKEDIEITKATLQDKREEYMIEQLPQTLLDFIEERPGLIQEKLENKEPINTLLFLGARHTRIYDAIKQANPHSKAFDARKQIAF
jgi:hypothetical protein